jgi:hypothetical protein
MKHVGHGLVTLIIALSAGSVARTPLFAVARPVQHHGAHGDVAANRVSVGAYEFVPRFAGSLTKVLVIPPGESVTLPADSTWDAIEVSGTLRVSRAHDTTVRFTHLLILPGGRLDAGTEDDPVLGRLEFVIRDVPLDVGRDPFQWGNGIVNFGTQTRVGRRVGATFTELVGDAPAAATTITVADAEGWSVGDELLLPDMRQIGATRGDAGPRREARVTIAAIEGPRITLSKPLDFEHTAIRDPDGGVVLRPRVANLTRNIVIRSENPAGTRGHTANIGPQASWDIRYNQFIGVGRTTSNDLDTTTVDAHGDITHIGTNQIGKYANHDHHGGSSLAVRQNIGNSYLGLGGSKWAHAVHGTHDTLVAENVCVDFQGGCFATEDGYEVRNTFRRNVAAYSIGNRRGADGNLNGGRNSPGGEGSGFWFRALHQVIEGNEAWNNVIGINLFNRRHVDSATPVPEERGGKSSTAVNVRRSVPIAFRGNVTISNSDTGLEYWTVQRFPAEDHISAHNREKQVWGVNSGSNHVYLRNPTLVASGGLTDCISTSEAYTPTLEVDGGAIRGCRIGIDRGGAKTVTVRGVVMQNRTNYSGRAGQSLFEDVMHLQLGALPKRFIVFGGSDVWEPGEPLPRRALGNLWQAQRGSQHVVRNWQRTGQDYRLLERQQLASHAAWPARDAEHTTFVPEEGLTVGEAWRNYGLAYMGDVVDDADAVQLDGLVNGVARAGLMVPLGPPRAVLTYPNMMGPAKVDVSRDGTRSVDLRLTMTGDYTVANEYVVVSIDGQSPVRLRRGQGQPEDRRGHITKVATPGTHEVRTWREDLEGRKIPQSEMTFRYFVADETQP